MGVHRWGMTPVVKEPWRAWGTSHEREPGAVDLDHIHVWEGLVPAMWRTDRAGRGREVSEPFITETGDGSEDKGDTR